jgi:hypothetical protein
MSVEISMVEVVSPKRAYQTPMLITYGLLRNLTQNGAGSADESNGSKMCGTQFTTKGGSGC